MPQPEEMAEGPMQYADEDEELLFGPTTRPDDHMGVAAKRAMIRRPGNLAGYAADLSRVAESPDAPAELIDLLRVLQYHTGGAR